MVSIMTKDAQHIDLGWAIKKGKTTIMGRTMYFIKTENGEIVFGDNDKRIFEKKV